MIMELFNIEGKKAIVTGGTRGLGYGMAEGLMEAGCEVVIVGTSDKVYDVAKGFCDRGFKCHGVKADFSKREQVYQGFNDCVAALGGDLDIIVNAHGIQRRHSAEVFPIEEWDEVLNVNLNSVFILCQEAAKIMLKRATERSSTSLPWYPGSAVRPFRHTQQQRAELPSSQRNSATTGSREASM